MRTAGYVPKSVTIQAGESVTFTNSDGVVHQIEFKPATGFTCSANPLVAQPAQVQSCTSSTAGNYSYSDPNQKGNTFHGTVAVAAVPGSSGALTLATSKALVVYGAKVRLSGKVTPSKAGTSVEIWARPYPEPSFAKIAAVVTAADGTFAYSVPPQVRTEYRTPFVDGSLKGQSPEMTVQVRPRVTLSVTSVKGSVARLRTGVVSTMSYGRVPVLVQRRNSQGGWTTVTTVRPGQFSSLAFDVRTRSGASRWRVYLQAANAGGGYVASFRPTRRITR